MTIFGRPIRDVDDALAHALALRDAVDSFEDGHPGSVIQENAPKPDPRHPGLAMKRWIERLGQTERMEGGNVAFGEWDCSRCRRVIYMEVAIDRSGKPIDSLGGVFYGHGDVILCDDCSPI